MGEAQMLRQVQGAGRCVWLPGKGLEGPRSLLAARGWGCALPPQELTAKQTWTLFPPFASPPPHQNKNPLRISLS